MYFFLSFLQFYHPFLHLSPYFLYLQSPSIFHLISFVHFSICHFSYSTYFPLPSCLHFKHPCISLPVTLFFHSHSTSFILLLFSIIHIYTCHSSSSTYFPSLSSFSVLSTIHFSASHSYISTSIPPISPFTPHSLWGGGIVAIFSLIYFVHKYILFFLCLEKMNWKILYLGKN